VLWAEETGSSQEKVKPGSWVFVPNVRLFGADLDIGYRGISFVRGVDTIFWVGTGGGYEQMMFYRYPDGTLYSGGDPAIDPKKDPFFWRIEGQWSLGISQGILWNDKLKANLLEGFLFYQGRYDAHLKKNDNQLLFRSNSVVDKEGIFQNSLLTGLSLNNLLLDKRSMTKNGYYAEISMEWAPLFLGNSIFGRADFLKLNVAGRFFLRVFNLKPETRKNFLSFYLGDFFSIDYITGSSIPLNASQTFGGRSPRIGLAIRGVDAGAFNSPFKIVNNIDARLNLPAIIWPGLIPGVLLYLDTGYYNELTGGMGKLFFTTGAGVYLSLFGIFSPTVYLQYFLNGKNAVGTALTPLSIAFDLRF
ncbi:MAG: hypothetical protein AB1798_13935, partial [Spirochaetota bacterium]